MRFSRVSLMNIRHLLEPNETIVLARSKRRFLYDIIYYKHIYMYIPKDLLHIVCIYANSLCRILSFEEAKHSFSFFFRDYLESCHRLGFRRYFWYVAYNVNTSRTTFSFTRNRRSVLVSMIFAKRTIGTTTVNSTCNRASVTTYALVLVTV